MDIHFNHTEPVHAPAETLFDVITDYAAYPSFNSSVTRVTVVTKNERGAEFLADRKTQIGKRVRAYDRYERDGDDIVVERTYEGKLVGTLHLAGASARRRHLHADDRCVAEHGTVRGIVMKPALKHLFYGINFTPFIEEAERRARPAAASARGVRHEHAVPAHGAGTASPVRAAASRISSARDEIPSFANTFRRWYSTVRGLRKSCDATSLFESPSPTSCAIWSSCGVSSSLALGSRRTVSPVARSSTRARSDHGSARRCSNPASAARSCVLASTRLRSRRRNSPYASSVRARSNGFSACACRRSGVR